MATHVISCKVMGCRYPFSHTTKGHICGHLCMNPKGHGQIECSRPLRRTGLEIHHGCIFDSEQQCKVPDCPNKEYHMTSAHYCPRCLKHLGENYRDHECMMYTLQEAFDTYADYSFREQYYSYISQLFIDEMRWDIFIRFPVGTIGDIYVRYISPTQHSFWKNAEYPCLLYPITDRNIHTHSLLNISEHERSIRNNFIDGLEDITHLYYSYMYNTLHDSNVVAAASTAPTQRDRSGGESEDDDEPWAYWPTLKCPICRTETRKDDIFSVKGVHDEKCSICLEACVTRFMKNCGHIPFCEDCFEKM